MSLASVGLVPLLALQVFGGPERNTREGAEHFESGRLEEALRAFSRAEAEFPDAPENDLNLAGVHYRMGEGGEVPAGEDGGPLAEALRGYQAALSAGVSGELRRDALFNLANTLYRSGAYREAAAAYGEAIAADPTDIEARQNLEHALRRAEEDEQQQDEQQQQSDSDQEQEQDDQQQQQNHQQQQQQQQQNSDDNQQSDSQQDQQQPEQQPEQQTEPPPEQSDNQQQAPPEDGAGNDTPQDGEAGEVPDISPEQAERILAALAEVERAFQESRLEARRARALRRGRH